MRAEERKIKQYLIADLIQCKSAGQPALKKKKKILLLVKATSSSAANFTGILQQFELLHSLKKDRLNIT